MSNLKAIFIIPILLLLLAGPLFSEANTDLGTVFRKGNVLYEKGDYKRAILEYEKIAKSGKESGELYYNIANCHIKLNNIGLAVLNYERAKRLIPRDADLASNLNFALSLVKEIKLNSSVKWYVLILNRFKTNFTVNEISVSCTLSLLALLIFILAKFFIGKKYKIIDVLILIGLLWLVFVVVSLGGKYSSRGREYVVLNDKVDVKFAPLNEATTHYTVYEGMKLYKLKSKGEWIKIKRIDGMAGWVKKDYIENI